MRHLAVNCTQTGAARRALQDMPGARQADRLARCAGETGDEVTAEESHHRCRATLHARRQQGMPCDENLTRLAQELEQHRRPNCHGASAE